jgi:hypothetical protein
MKTNVAAITASPSPIAISRRFLDLGGRALPESIS